MKICVVGAGAIGGYLAVKLALAGHEVSVVARGNHLAAIRQKGLRLVNRDSGAELRVQNILASDRMADLGPQDCILLALKAHQIAAVAADLRALYGPATPVVTLQNGIPWWYFHRHGGPLAGTRLESVDPGGLIGAQLEPDRIIGCVVYKGAEVIEPGVIRHTKTAGDKFPLGELDGSETPRIRAISEALEGAGVRAPVIPDIRAEKWFKLWGNLAWNPICALTHAHALEVYQSPEASRLSLIMMREAQAIAEKLGIRFRGTPEDRMQRIHEIGPTRPSMLQDTEAGRPLEVDALVGAVVELAGLTDTPAPHVEAVYACAKLLSGVVAGRRVRIVPQPLD